MSTEFFLADRRFMNEDEIAQAESFDDEAKLCHRSGQTYSLELPIIHFFNLPEDIRVVNNNNDLRIKTVGDLIEQMRADGKTIVPEHESRTSAEKSLEELRLERQNRLHWKGVLSEVALPEASRVMKFIRRGIRKTT